MEDLSSFLYFFVSILILIFVICHAALAVFLYGFSRKVEGEPNIMSWIPLANIYLLGKLTFNKDTGYILVALLILSCTLTLQIDKTTIVLSMPGIVQVVLGAIFAGAFVVVLIFGVRKCTRLEESTKKKTENKKKNKEIEKEVKTNDKVIKEEK